MCPKCYKDAYHLDMTVARPLKWEEPNEIVPNLWLGGEGSTLNKDWLEQHGIKRILTVATHMDRLPKHEGIEYMQVDIDDDPGEDLRPHWDACFAFIEAVKASGSDGVLVHCVSGISRSGATVTAWLMKQRGLSYDQALTLVRRKRPQVSPNGGFQAQLRDYEMELRVACSTQQ